jgi:hypothetical protein
VLWRGVAVAPIRPWQSVSYGGARVGKRTCLRRSKNYLGIRAGARRSKT